MKRTTKKLTIQAETLRTLAGRQLQAIRGGQMASDDNSGCLTNCDQLCVTLMFECSTGVPCTLVSQFCNTDWC